MDQHVRSIHGRSAGVQTHAVQVRGEGGKTDVREKIKMSVCGIWRMHGESVFGCLKGRSSQE